LNVIQGARIAGAARIIAVDAMEAKLLLAKKFGATATLLAKPGEDLAKALKKLTGGGPTMPSSASATASSPRPRTAPFAAAAWRWWSAWRSPATRPRCAP